MQSLACCMLNQSADPKLQTTLIICPMSLMSNWRARLGLREFDDMAADTFP